MSSSLKKLVEDILKESTAKAEQLRAQSLTEIEETIAKERAEAIREADQMTRNAEAEADATRNRLISQAKQKARLAFLTERNRVVHAVMEDVKTRLDAFVRDESSYQPFLLKAIALGVEAIPSEVVSVALSEKDLTRFKHTRLLQDALAGARTTKKAALSDEPIQTIGGAVVTSEDGRIRADYTFEARLGLMEPKLLAEISRILFAS